MVRVCFRGKTSGQSSGERVSRNPAGGDGAAGPSQSGRGSESGSPPEPVGSGRPSGHDEEQVGDVAPHQVGSILTREELDTLHRRYFVSADFSFDLALPGEDVQDPRSWKIGFYEESFRAGLRLPLAGPVGELLRHFSLCPSQLSPNSWRAICGFFSLCTSLGVPHSGILFRYFFTLKSTSDWWYFTPRKGFQLLRGLPSSIHGWKDRYFFVSTDLPWPCSRTAGVPTRKALKVPRLSISEKADADRLGSAQVPHVRDLLVEGMLVKAGLSPAKPEAMGSRSTEAELEEAFRRRMAPSLGEPSRAARATSAKRPVAVAKKASKRARTSPSSGDAEVHPSSGAPEVAQIGRPASTSVGGVLPGEASPEVVEVFPAGAVEVSVSLSREPAEAVGGAMGESAPPAAQEPMTGETGAPTYVPAWRVHPGDSGLASEEVARELVRGIVLPRDISGARSATPDQLLSNSYLGVVRYARDVLLLGDSLQRQKEQLTEVEERLRQAVAAATASKAEADREIERLRERSSGLEAQLQEKVVHLGDAERELESARADLGAALAQNTILEGDLQIAKDALSAAEKKASESETRAVEAEGRVAEAAKRGVEEYIASEEYRTILGDSTLDGFMRGFQNFRRQVFRVAPKLDLSRFQPVFGGGDDEEGEMEAELPSDSEGSQAGPDDAASS